MSARNPLNAPISRRAMLAGSTVAAAAALAGCKKSDADGTAASTGGSSDAVLTYHIENPTGIEPYTLEDENAVAVAFNLFDALTYYDYKTGELTDLVAESHTHSDDDTVWTFKIRKGTKFHDGSEVTAKSFAYAWRRLCNPSTGEQPSNVSYHLAMVKGYEDVTAGSATELSGVTCPDDYTLQVELSQPYADFDYVCAAPVLSPVPEGAGAGDDYTAFAHSPIGNGPFKMKGEWEDGQYVEAEAFADYANGEAPKVAGVRFNIYKDSNTAYKELDAGSLDCSLVPITATKQAKDSYGESEDGYTATPDHQFLGGAMLYTQFLAFNVNDPVMSDVRVRQALSLAINRQAICDAIYEGSAQPADDILPSSMEGYREGAWAYAAYDPDKAAQLLDEAGYAADANGKRNLSIALTYNLDGDHKAVMEMVMADWSALGIETSSNTAEWASILSNTYPNADFQVGRLGWIADYPIMDNFLYPLFVTGGDNNYGQYSNADVDKGLLDARAIASDDDRVAKYQEVDKLIAEDMPVIPLFYYKHQMVCSQRVKSLYMDPQKLCDMSTVELSA